MRKKVILSVLLLAILLAVLLLPFPTPVNQQMQGVMLSPDGAVESSFSCTLSGWHLRYLLRDDALKVTLDVPREETQLQDLQSMGPVFGLVSDEYLVTTYHAMDRAENHSIFGYFLVKPDYSGCCLKTDRYYLICSAEEDFDPAAILAQCNDLLD